MRIEEHGGPRVDDIERFDHMLPLALWISGHTRDVFEIDLPARHRGGTLHRLLDTLAALGNPIMAFEHAINGLARGDGQLEELQEGITLQVIANGLLSGDASQAFWRLIAHGEDQLDHQRMGRGRWGLAGSRVPLQDVVQPLACGQLAAYAFEPFFHPTRGTAQGGGELAMRPVGMLVPQII